MKKTGLSQEQIDYIKDHYYKSGFSADEFTEDDIYWYLDEFGAIDSVDENERRHWKEVIAIVDLAGRFFGFHTAYCSGDHTADEMGFVPNSEINEYEAVEIKAVTYKLIS